MMTYSAQRLLRNRSSRDLGFNTAVDFRRLGPIFAARAGSIFSLIFAHKLHSSHGCTLNAGTKSSIPIAGTSSNK